MAGYGTSTIKSKILEVLAVGVAMVGLLIVAGMTAAASIEENLKVGVITAAGFSELYLLLWMIKQF